ncbi:porin family protein [Nibrella saemangeumensis]
MHLNFSVRLFTLLTATIFFCHTVTYAQQRWSAGPRLGLNLSKFVGTGNDTRYAPGAVVGGFIMYSDIRHFGASLDVLYSQKGARQGAPATTIDRINYLELPLAFRYFLTLNGDFRPNIFVGPSLAFNLNNQQFKNSDIGLFAGLQLNWRAGNRQRFLIDGKYTYGLPDIYIGPGSNVIETHNSTFTLTLGYSFGIGRNY